MATQSDFNMSLSVTETVTIAGQQVSVTHHADGPTGSLDANSVPPVTKPGKAVVAVNGDVVVDLTNLEVLVESDEDSATLTRDLTGLKIYQIKFRTPIANTVKITVEPGDTNPFPIGTRVLYPNACDGFFGPNNTDVVGPTSKNVKLSSTAPATISIVIAAGT